MTLDLLTEVSSFQPLSRSQRLLLLTATAICSGCALAAELLLGTLASYLVGNQALAYGVAVGGFLAAMGIGAYFSRFIGDQGEPAQQQQQLLLAFVQIELLIAPLIVFLPLGLFALFVVSGPLWLGLVLVTGLLGTLAGLEVPLLTRLLEQDEGVRDALSGVLALDYLGALLGSLAFPVLLLPVLGLFPSAAVIGALPAFMVFALGRAFAQSEPKVRAWSYWGLVLGLGLCAFAPVATSLGDRLENTQYNAPIIARIQSPYQRIVLTRQGADVRLFLDGDLQFSTLDEYRYHEALVHPAMSASSTRRRVLLLGAGDGLALREVLKWPEVERVLLIDLDQAVVNLARRHPFLTRVNAGALVDPRVEVQQADAFVAAPALDERFDVIIADFPDPDRETIAKLYAEGFYQRLLPRLAAGGVLVTQASSPFFAPRAFACIAATLQAVGLAVQPYVIDVPSFGPWGFVLASRTPITPTTLQLPVATRFLRQPMLAQLFQLPGDIEIGPVEVNRLAYPIIVRYQDDPRWAAYQ
ncbi:polyamine aminopropyltransferase [Leptolyngbya sp. FACHB-261]|uniref:polyamine aminopropyltransferase n=1 Tax=Leptolyngbya sp. FACHB-261 TaxID=2692806 RepID=UPI001683C09C|nr:polyamine aminopropyltransferase [Leptolyngbya sp. FACHB-261]MBD2103631.1 polyamine aminopropyltransferase [Leptolyngbya sp. FACHB-261]